MVTVGTGSKGTRFVRTEYPVEEGLEAGTTKQEGNVSNLVPNISLIPISGKRGLDGR